MHRQLADPTVQLQNREAAEQGDPDAQHNLANLLFHGIGGHVRNVLLAEQWNDKALVNTNDAGPWTMQGYLLAERLRRVKNAPLTQEVIPFPFKPLPTDVLEKQPAKITYNVSCEACGKSVPVDGGKKYCFRCKVTVYCSIFFQKSDWKRHKKVCGKEPKTDILGGKDKQAYKDDLEV